MNENKMFTDKIGKYLISEMDNYIFDELSDEYLDRIGLTSILKDVPVPIKKTEATKITNVKIAHGMAVIIGTDLNFKFRNNYVDYIIKSFGVDFVKPLINEGIEHAGKMEFHSACICFRAALIINPESVDALYCYARACKDAYEQGDDEEYVGRFKAEALEGFEKLTLKAPDFDMGFYFLGYAYLNLGLYLKAKLTWEDFIKLTNDDESKKDMKDEIENWLIKLEEPIKIEEAYNMVLSGRFEEGLNILSGYKEDERFNKWWPLWYYMGIAHENLGLLRESIADFKQVLILSPSNIETMKELVKVYEEVGDKDGVDKYTQKITLLSEDKK